MLRTFVIITVLVIFSFVTSTEATAADCNLIISPFQSTGDEFDDLLQAYGNHERLKILSPVMQSKGYLPSKGTYGVGNSKWMAIDSLDCRIRSRGVDCSTVIFIAKGFGDKTIIVEQKETSTSCDGVPISTGIYDSCQVAALQKAAGLFTKCMP